MSRRISAAQMSKGLSTPAPFSVRHEANENPAQKQAPRQGDSTDGRGGRLRLLAEAIAHRAETRGGTSKRNPGRRRVAGAAPVRKPSSDFADSLSIHITVSAHRRLARPGEPGSVVSRTPAHFLRIAQVCLFFLPQRSISGSVHLRLGSREPTPGSAETSGPGAGRFA